MVRYFECGLICAAISISHVAMAQETGPVESFGQNGKLFATSKGPSESRNYFLVSRKSFEYREILGYNGDARVVITNIQLGGFEVKSFQYMAVCQNGQTAVTFSEDDSRGESGVIHDVKRGRTPDKTRRVSYNLFWAACEKQFQKFK